MWTKLFFVGDHETETDWNFGIYWVGFDGWTRANDLLPEGLLCSRDIGWVKENDVWIVSVRVRVRPSVCWCRQIAIKLEFWLVLRAYLRRKFQEAGSGCQKTKTRIVHNSGFEQIASEFKNNPRLGFLFWSCGELWENLEAKSCQTLLRVWQTSFFTNLDNQKNFRRSLTQ